MEEGSVTVDTTVAPTWRSARLERLYGPARLLRLEGVLLLATAIGLYGHLDAGWWWFVALLLAPDVGLLGYLAGLRVGSATYNLTHTLSLPLALGVAGMATDNRTMLAGALIWAAHIGMDRAVGYGLKYPTGFRDTHLQRVA
jgi:hypothetical protein